MNCSLLMDAYVFGDLCLIRVIVVMSAVTILGLIVMVTLFAHELTFYLTTYTMHQVCFVLVDLFLYD